MSAELYDAEHEGALARPAIDILPTPGGRKAKVAVAEEPTAVPEPAPAEWAAPLAQAANPWGDPVVAPTQVAPVAPVAPVAHVAQALPPAAGLPLALPDFPEPAAADDAAAPKKVLGMQIRRAKKPAEPALDAAPDVAVEAAPVEYAPQVAPSQAEAYPASAPLAAWPTDGAMPVVAHAEPAQQPFAAAGSDDAGHSEAADYAPVQPADQAPVAPVVDDREVRALRAMVDAGEAGRVEAENRAALAVAYAQAAQAQLADANSKAQAQIQAAEAKARVAANDAQDWQIRHREAEATIAELATSVAGAEQRLSELRAERDELLASLEDATRPDHAPVEPS